MVTLIILGSLGPWHLSHAETKQFVATVTEHRTIFQLRQPYEFELIAIHNPIDEITVSFEEQENGRARLSISPRLLEVSYRIIDTRDEQDRSPLVVIRNSIASVLAPSEETADHAVYELTDTELFFVSDDEATVSFELIPRQKNEFQFGSFSVAIAEKNNTTPGKLTVSSDTAIDIPQGLRAASPTYRYTLMRPDAGTGTIPLQVKIKYTGTDTDSRSVYRYDEELKKWTKLLSYHNVEDHFVQAEASSANSLIALFASPDSDDGIASWYRYKGCLCAASRVYPKGTRLTVTRLKTNKSIVVRINDYGPEEWTGRIIDLDATAFRAIGSLGAGLIYVNVSPASL